MLKHFSNHSATWTLLLFSKFIAARQTVLSFPSAAGTLYYFFLGDTTSILKKFRMNFSLILFAQKIKRLRHCKDFL